MVCVFWKCIHSCMSFIAYVYVYRQFVRRYSWANSTCEEELLVNTVGFHPPCGCSEITSALGCWHLIACGWFQGFLKNKKQLHKVLVLETFISGYTVVLSSNLEIRWTWKSTGRERQSRDLFIQTFTRDKAAVQAEIFSVNDLKYNNCVSITLWNI